MNEFDDSNDVILAWKDTMVFNVTIENQLEFEPPYMTDSKKLEENMAFVYLCDFSPFKSKCITTNLGTEEDSKPIKAYEGLSLEKLKK